MRSEPMVSVRKGTGKGICAGLVLASWMVGRSEAQAQALEPNIDRTGSDYTSGVSDSPEACKAACASAWPKCLSFTYARTPVGNLMLGKCFLKDKIPTPFANTCCVSGINPNYRAMHSPSRYSQSVWRSQLFLVMGSHKSAGSDDDFAVKLNPQNKTWVDYAHDDFEKGDVFAYDLLTSNVSKVSDISTISLSKTGNDGMCIRGFVLLVDGRPVYTEDFSGEPDGCHWLDSEAGYSNTYTVDTAKLQSNSLWRNLGTVTPSLTIPADEIHSRLEGIIGDALHGTDAGWHGSLKVGRASATSIYADVHLWISKSCDFVVDLCPDGAVDATVYVSFGCSGGQITVTPTLGSVDADFGWAGNLYYGLIEGIAKGLGIDALPGFDLTAYKQKINTPLTTCPNITVQNNGDVTFSF